MTSKELVTILTVAGSITLFGSWLNENIVEKKLNERLNLIESYSRKITASKFENVIMEIRLWNIHNLFMQDTLNYELKKSLYNNMLEYFAANVKRTEIANEGYMALYPNDTTSNNEGVRNAEDLKSSYKIMLDEDTNLVSLLNSDFITLAADNHYAPIYDSDIFEGIATSNYADQYNLNLAYLNRVWLYIIGSLFLASAYILHRRNEH